MRGKPLACRCPNCRKPAPERVGTTRDRIRKPSGRRAASKVVEQGRVHCTGCGHVWWSSHPWAVAKKTMEVRDGE